MTAEQLPVPDHTREARRQLELSIRRSIEFNANYSLTNMRVSFDKSTNQWSVVVYVKFKPNDHRTVDEKRKAIIAIITKIAASQNISLNDLELFVFPE